MSLPNCRESGARRPCDWCCTCCAKRKRRCHNWLMPSAGCAKCHNISDSELCPICSNPRRDGSTICVVENIQDVMAVENTQQFHGLYHVLGGVISPMDGIGPSDLEIESLVERVSKGEVKEVILALSSTMEGDTTNFYIFRKLAPYHDVKISIIARGISVGDELEYTDEVTLGRSILNRTIFEGK